MHKVETVGREDGHLHKLGTQPGEPSGNRAAVLTRKEGGGSSALGPSTPHPHPERAPVGTPPPPHQLQLEGFLQGSWASPSLGAGLGPGAPPSPGPAGRSSRGTSLRTTAATPGTVLPLVSKPPALSGPGSTMCSRPHSAWDSSAGVWAPQGPQAPASSPSLQPDRLRRLFFADKKHRP